jgi:hypothetical protein
VGRGVRRTQPEICRRRSPCERHPYPAQGPCALVNWNMRYS